MGLIESTSGQLRSRERRRETVRTAKNHETCKVEIQGMQRKDVPLNIKELGSHVGTSIGGKEKIKGECSTRVVEIEEHADHAAMLLRQVGVHYFTLHTSQFDFDCVLS
ncbi:hypothetical protein CRYUN_Cryun23aG0152500 [Craigia yunnanensis]